MKKKDTQTDQYKEAGVDIEAGNDLVSKIKPMLSQTHKKGIIGNIGQFAGLFELPKHFKEPVLVSGTDGVGTKLKIAFKLKIHNTIGIDLGAMSVNDKISQGAQPLFFLDYFACSKLEVKTATKVVEGIVKGCELGECSLIGGETAEMPGLYNNDEYDLAGFAVGVVEKEKIIDGSNVRAGDVVLGLASSGVHSNGFSLVHKIIDSNGISLSQKVFGDKNIGEILLTPTKIYAKPILELKKKIQIKSIAHITGGGLVENLPRAIPEFLKAEINSESWEKPEVFDWIKKEGNISESEMMRIFNNGIGITLIVSPSDVDTAQKCLSDLGEKAFQIGKITNRKSNCASILIE